MKEINNNLLEKIYAELVSTRADLAQMSAKVSLLEKKVQVQQQEEEELIDQKELGILTKKKYTSVHRDYLDGLYNMPDGFTKPAYFRSGNQDSPLFYPSLALLYHDINKFGGVK